MNFSSESVAVITGAGSGIGQALAWELSQAGVRLAINDHNAERLEETSRQIRSQGGTVYPQAFDVSNRADMLTFADNVKDRFGRVDLMINNAGVALGQIKFEDISHADFEWILNINFWGVIHGTTAFLPLLRNQTRAKLVNVCSSFGLLAVPEQAPYCASKFAVRGFTDSLRLELMDTGVRVTLVCPSQVRTNIIRHGRHKTDQAKQELIKKYDTLLSHIAPRDAAKTIVQGLRKNREFISIGHDAKVFHFASRFVPRFVIKAMTRRALKKLARLETPMEPEPAV